MGVAPVVVGAHRTDDLRVADSSFAVLPCGLHRLIRPKPVGFKDHLTR
ncbi:MAG: hypothetical protein P1V36_16890 [Planctomycetota bacterium]|nr:hypothetical protein [Planctomycetota bacterium]